MPRQLPIGGRIAASDIGLSLDRTLSARIGLDEWPIRQMAGRTTGRELYQDVSRTTNLTTSWMETAPATTGNLRAGDMLYIYGGGVAHWYRWTYTSADNLLVLNDTSPPTSIAQALGTFATGIGPARTTSGLTEFSTAFTTHRTTYYTGTGDFAGNGSRTTDFSTSSTTARLTSWSTNESVAGVGFRINDGQSITWSLTGQDLGTYGGTFVFRYGAQVNISVFDVRTFTIYPDGTFRVFGGGFGNSSFRLTINDNGNTRITSVTKTATYTHTTSWSTVLHDAASQVRSRIAYSDLHGKAPFLLFPTEKTPSGSLFMGQDYGLASYISYNARRIFSGTPVTKTTSWDVTKLVDYTTAWTTNAPATRTTLRTTSWTTTYTYEYTGGGGSASGGGWYRTGYRTTSRNTAITTNWTTYYTTSAVTQRNTTYTTSKLTSWITYPTTTVSLQASRSTTVTGPKAMSRTTSWTTNVPMSRTTSLAMSRTTSRITTGNSGGADGGGGSNRTTYYITRWTSYWTTEWLSARTTSATTSWTTQHTTTYTTSWMTTKTTAVVKAVVEFNAAFTGDWSILNSPLYGDISLGVNTEGQACETTVHTITALRGCKNGNSQTKTVVYRLNALRNDKYEVLKIGYTYTQASCGSPVATNVEYTTSWMTNVSLSRTTTRGTSWTAVGIGDNAGVVYGTTSRSTSYITYWTSSWITSQLTST